jgi:cell wall-associated NlpC family hydrolase
VHAVRSHRRPTQRKTRISWALGTLIGVVTAGAVIAPAAYAGSATRTTISGAATVKAGQSAKLGGSVQSQGRKLSGAMVEIQSSTGSGWKRGAAKRAGSNGVVTFVVKPSQTTYYRFTFRGNMRYSASVSPGARVAVPVDKGVAVVRTAASLKGAPYRYGAAGPRAFDCSGFTQYVLKRHGKSLPHSATQQARYGKTVSKTAARPGDLLFFGSGSRYSHVAIYAGSGKMWDASTSGKPVAKKDIWSNRYVVRRVV